MIDFLLQHVAMNNLRRLLSMGVAMLMTAAALNTVSAGSATAIHGLGSFDLAFGDQGVSRAAFDSLGNLSVDKGTAVTIQADGKIVVAGSAGDDEFSTMAVVRFLPTGQLDPTFGAGGKRQIGFQAGAHSGANAVKVDTSGRIVVAGYVADEPLGSDSSAQFALTRLTAAGAIDTTYGNNGRVVTDVGAGGGEAKSLFVLENGKAIVAGYGRADGGADPKGKLIRYTAAGSPDGSFGVAGVVTLAGLVGRDWVVPASMDVQFSGHIVVGGRITVGVNSYGFVAKVSADGVLDNSFGTTGYRELNLQGTDDQVTAVQVLDDGQFFNNPKILATTAVSFEGQQYSVIYRFANNGAADASYGTNGVAFLIMPGFVASSLFARADGSSVAVATVNGQQVLVWVSAQGQIDNRYGLNGASFTNLPGSSTAQSVAVGPSGIAYAAGSQTIVNSDFLVTAWHADAVPPPLAPRITRIAKTGNRFILDFAPGSANTTGFKVTYQPVAANGVARQQVNAGELTANARQIVVRPGTPNVVVRIVATGRYDNSAPAVGQWRTQLVRAPRGCPRVIPSQVRFAGNGAAVVRFGRRNSGCATWRYLPGRFTQIMRGRVRVASPPIAIGALGRFIFRSGNAIVRFHVRRG